MLTGDELSQSALTGTPDMGSSNVTSVPLPGVESTVARPPASSARSSSVSMPRCRRTPWARRPIRAGSKPRPSSRTEPRSMPSETAICDLEVAGLRVAADVRDGLAHRPVGDLLDHERDRLGRDADLDVEVGLAAGLRCELAHRLREALRRAQLEHQPAGAVGGGGERLPRRLRHAADRVGVGASRQPVEREERRGQHLHRVVVELRGDPAPFLLLGAEQARDDLAALGLASVHELLERPAAGFEAPNLGARVGRAASHYSNPRSTAPMPSHSAASAAAGLPARSSTTASTWWASAR